jgi:hypothetical protein
MLTYREFYDAISCYDYEMLEHLTRRQIEDERANPMARHCFVRYFKFRTLRRGRNARKAYNKMQSDFEEMMSRR